MTPLQESLSKCRIEGNTLFLPDIKEGPLANYNEVRTSLLNAGAKYKRNTFVFPGDAQPYIDRLMGGEKVNIKKEFQFFGTPAKLADRLVALAQLKTRHMVLEPSAGQGAIIDAIKRVSHPIASVDYWELMPENRTILSEKYPLANMQGHDFLSKQENGRPSQKYDRIIANPPFSKNQDIDHIMKMWDCLADGGRIVTIASKHWQYSNNKKETAFREWIDKVGAQVWDIDAGEFKESGTSIATVIIVINK